MTIDYTQLVWQHRPPFFPAHSLVVRVLRKLWQKSGKSQEEHRYKLSPCSQSSEKWHFTNTMFWTENKLESSGHIGTFFYPKICMFTKTENMGSAVCKSLLIFKVHTLTKPNIKKFIWFWWHIYSSSLYSPLHCINCPASHHPSSCA